MQIAYDIRGNLTRSMPCSAIPVRGVGRRHCRGTGAQARSHGAARARLEALAGPAHSLRGSGERRARSRTRNLTPASLAHLLEGLAPYASDPVKQATLERAR
jgi:hypothetical protein